jgi:hypothetical protein
MSNEQDAPRKSWSVADIPQHVLDGVVRDQLGIFAVGILGVKFESGQPSLRLCGSGTLVYAGGAHYILTAAHVWSKQLRLFDYVALTLKELDSHEFLTETSFMKPHYERVVGRYNGPRHS